MIGVVTSDEHREIAREFFELFKTPWEFFRADRRYDVVLDATGAESPRNARVVITYGTPGTDAAGIREGAMLLHRGDRMPLYGRCLTFPTDRPHADLVVDATREPVTQLSHAGSTLSVRIGYDLFSEIGYLLCTGQPAAHAAIPTLERHIGVLRDCILAAGIPLVEIPPVPAGYRFLTCLTHDADHPSIKLHGLDRTAVGFLSRAVGGSLVRAFTGRMTPAALSRNLGAAARLPLVHMGLARDFWSGFDEYLEIERGLGSTFFVIPQARQPGRTMDGPAPSLRGAAYGVADIAASVKQVATAGAEVGLHGIDAWLDAAAGRSEREEVSSVSALPTTGVRMHWLFWNGQTPERLEAAGFAYDSTVGYNETVGFRAGTAQAFKPLTAKRLLELPLTVMDTALFYPSYLNLTDEAARQTVTPLIDHIEAYGGALVTNWHDRSLAPERQWDGFYRRLIEDLKRRDAWFPTASQAAAWFQQRRSAVFDSVSHDGQAVHLRASVVASPRLPGLVVRVHTSQKSHTDLVLEDGLDTRVSLVCQ